MYIDRINSVIDYIESHLTDEISYRELAAMLAMSVYERSWSARRCPTTSGKGD